MTDRNKVLPTKFATPMEDEWNKPKSERHNYTESLPVDNEPGKMNKPAPEGAHISDKVYLFPDSYNALRLELHDNWPTLWAQVGWYMAFDAVAFIEQMDAALDCKTTFDSDKVSAICHRYLNMLRNKRGLSSLSYDSSEVK